MKLDFRNYDHKERCPECGADMKVITGFLRSENMYSHVRGGVRCAQRQYLRLRAGGSPYIIVREDVSEAELDLLKKELRKAPYPSHLITEDTVEKEVERRR